MIEFAIVQGKPNIWQTIKEKVPGAADLNPLDVYITCGNKIFAESKMPREILEHEQIHVRQQTVEMNKEEWWDKWLNDLEFRYKVELEGYRKQVQVYCQLYAGQNQQFNYKKKIATILCGPMYGNLRGFQQVLLDLS